jgi:hypothetical protein
LIPAVPATNYNRLESFQALAHLFQRLHGFKSAKRRQTMKDTYRQEHIGENASEHIHIMRDWHRRIAPWSAPYAPEIKRYMPGTGEPISDQPDTHAGQTFDSELSQWETDGGK